MEQVIITNLCSASDCKKEAKLCCPDCKKYRIKKGNLFCGKDCFKASWSTHKELHNDCI